MLVDNDRKFYDKDVQKLVELYSTENDEKFSVIENFIKLLRKMFKSISLLILQEYLLIYLTYL